MQIVYKEEILSKYKTGLRGLASLNITDKNFDNSTTKNKLLSVIVKQLNLLSKT